jgi:hypothetical protein
MSNNSSGLLPKNSSYVKELILPIMTGRQKKDLKILYTLDKNELLALCENDRYVFNLCNTDPILYDIITTISPNI